MSSVFKFVLPLSVVVVSTVELPFIVSVLSILSLVVILSFVFAFRVQKIRIKTMEEYRGKQAKDKIENQFLKVQNCWVNSKNSVHAGVRNFYYYIYA